MDVIRRFTGVCPQHDILWDDLTAREHLDIFARLKNIPAAEREQEIEARLASVALTNVGDHLASSYSGGMKRRLSVAISRYGEIERY
jgi:ABC-type multidrug transport system ATPase subunit